MSGEQTPQLSLKLCFVMYSAIHGFERVYKPILDSLSLTYPQYLVMVTLWEQDGLTVKAIGKHLHLESGTLTPMLKRLQALGYVQRNRDLPDERMVRITLTEQGREIRDEVATARRKVMQAVYASGHSEEWLQVLTREINELSMALWGEAERAANGAAPEDAPILIASARRCS